MKRKRIITQFLLYFLMLMFLIVSAGCSDDDDDNDQNQQQQQQLLITISGNVSTAGGVPVRGVVMSAMFQLEVLNINLVEGSFTSDQFSFIMTDQNGNYSLRVPAALIEPYTLILTPAKAGYTFTPVQRVLTIGTTDQVGINFTAAAKVPYTLSNLAGIWRVKILRAGNENQWTRARIEIDNTGSATCLSFETSDNIGNTVCPENFELTFAVDTEGVITQSGANASLDAHMTMNSDKDFMAGTGTDGSNYQLIIAQKEPANLTQYNPADIQGKNFVFHSLSVGGVNEWRYGFGSTGTASGMTPGLITMTSESTAAAPNGTAATTFAGTLEVDANGVVTNTDDPTFEGFLSADEKTIVATYLGGNLNVEYKLMVIQLTDGQTMSTMTGTSVNHLLAVSDANDPPYFWAYHDVNVSRFGISFLPDILHLSFPVNIMLSYNWGLSLPLTDAESLLMTSLEKLNIGSTGEAVIRTLGTTANPSVIMFHGQLAYDGTFMVGVETVRVPDLVGVNVVYTNYFALDVITH